MTHLPFSLPAEDAGPTTKRPVPIRHHVLLNAAKLFASRERHSKREIALFQELALNLHSQTCVEDRRRIACYLVRHPDTPETVLAALAGDEDPLTAYPMLRTAPALPQSVLRRQAERGPDSLRKAILNREDIQEETLLALAEHGGPEVAGMLLDGAHARGTRDFEARLAEKLSARAEILSEFGDVLFKRGALSHEHMVRHFPWLPAAVRKEALACAELSGLVQLARSGAAKPARPVFKPDVLAQIEAAARASDPLAFAGELARVLGLPDHTARHAVLDDNGETLAICLKVLGLGHRAAAAVLIRVVGERTDLSSLRNLLDLFSRISQGAALIFVSSWTAGEPDRIPHAPAVHQPLHQERTPARRPADRTLEEISEIEKLLRFGA